MRMLCSVIVLLVCATPFSAQAETLSFSCERFKSNCTGQECYKLVNALQKDTTRQIFTVKKTEIVDYKIDATGAVETLRGEQAVPDKDRQLIIHYKFVASEYGKIVMANRDPKNIMKEEAQIEPTSGFYLYYLIHTDGSIKDVPIGEPYTAYFGWCENMSAPGAKLPEANPTPATVPETSPSTAPAPDPTPNTPPTHAPVSTTPPEIIAPAPPKP